MPPKLNPNHETRLRFDLECTDGTFATDDLQTHPVVRLPNCFPETKLERQTYSVCLSGHSALGLADFAAELELVAHVIRRHAGTVALAELEEDRGRNELQPGEEEYDPSNDPPGAPPPPATTAEPKPKKPRAPRRSKAELTAKLAEIRAAALAAGVDPAELDAIEAEKVPLSGKIVKADGLLQKARAAAPTHTDPEQPPLPGTD